MPIPELDSSRSTGPSFETEGELHHLDFPRPPQPWRRMLAFFIDFSIIHACSLFLGRWTSILMLRYLISSDVAVGMNDAEFAGIYSYAILLIWPLYLLFLGYGYYLTFLTTWGTTIGKGILGLEVVSNQGEHPNHFEASRRYFFSLINVATWGVSFYLMAYGDRGLCVQDRASGTYVQRRLHGSGESPQVAKMVERELAQSTGAKESDSAA